MIVTPELMRWIERREYVASGVAPHSATTRDTITTPSGTRYLIDTVYMRLRRASSASTNGYVVAMLSFTPSGGTARAIAGLQLYDNTVGYSTFATVPVGLVLYYLDSLSIVTYDLSTGGTVDYQVTLTYITL